MTGMFWRINAIGSMLLIGLTSCETQEIVSEETPRYYSQHHVLLEVDEIDALEAVVFVDLRTPEQYASGHLPGAVNIHRSEFQRKDLPYGGMALESEEMAELLGNKGVSEKDFLVLYDDKGGVEASRLWWILKLYGHNQVRILNGGLHVWKGDLDKNQRKPSITSFTFTAEADQDLIIDYDTFEAWREISGVKVLDCRSEAEYEGEYMKEGAFLAGHVEGAVNICYSHTIGSPEQRMRIKSPDELRQVYQNFAQPEDTILVYCQSGVRSAHTLMVLKEILGYKHVYNYDGSWIEWSFMQRNNELRPS